MTQDCTDKEISCIALAEKMILGRFITHSASNPVFIVGSPRTGSTVLYQAMIKSFNFPYLSNFTNECFSQHPIVGLALQDGMNIDISLENHFGKTKGNLQPSEGSAVLSKWFGGLHPSQDMSTCILEGLEEHFFATLAAVEALYDGRPLLIKNQWNCFRIPYLARSLPKARFIWIKRDIAEAAESDLEARYMTKGSAFEWNSATPSNWEELKHRPPHEQVVENQFEYNKAINDSLMTHAQKRSIEVWFENFVRSPDLELARVAKFLDIPVKKSAISISLKDSRQRQVSREESAAIRAYLNNHRVRFAGSRYSKLVESQ